MADEDSSLKTGGGARARARAPRAFLLATAVIVAVASCKPDAPTEPSDDRFRVTLEWDAPTLDAVGAPLADLEGYRIHYRASSPADGPGSVTVDVGDVTRVTLPDVPAGAWFFGVTARDAAGNESALSNEVQFEVGP